MVEDHVSALMDQELFPASFDYTMYRNGGAVAFRCARGQMIDDD